MPPVLLIFLLLFQFKQARFLRFAHLAGDGLALEFVLLLLQLDGLLGLRSDAGGRSLSARFTLHPLRAFDRLLCNSCHSRAEPEFLTVFQNEFEQFAVTRFCAEGYFRGGQTTSFHILENAHPERVFEKHRQSKAYFAHDNSLLLELMSKERTTRRGRLLTLKIRTAGLPTGSGISEDTRCVFIFALVTMQLYSENSIMG